MNIEYLDTLPEVENKYQFALRDDEKAVFVARLDQFGTDKDWRLGSECVFTLTNKRIYVNSDSNIWMNDIAEDIISCDMVVSKFFFRKIYYFSVTLNKEKGFSDGKKQYKLKGFHYYFGGSDTTKFEEIMNHVFH